MLHEGGHDRVGKGQLLLKLRLDTEHSRCGLELGLGVLRGATLLKASGSSNSPGHSGYGLGWGQSCYIHQTRTSVVRPAAPQSSPGDRTGHTQRIRTSVSEREKPLLRVYTYIYIYILPSHLFPVFEGRLATPDILPEHLNRGHITRFLSLRPPIPIPVRY